MAKELTLDEKLAAALIELPADTSDAVKEIVLAKHEEAQALAAEKQTITEQAAAELKKLQTALRDTAAKAAKNSFGSFKVGSETYEVRLHATQFLNENGEWVTITAEELVKDASLQAMVVEKGFGIAVKK